MIKLALIGKNISHSKSPEVYRGFLGEELDYTLLDYASEAEIPKVEKLFQTYQGISITSPYKQHFLGQVNLVGVASELKAINCLRKKEGIFEGCNTDYLAIVDILKKYMNKFEKMDILVLGDGVMSRTVIHALQLLQLPYQMISRKKTAHFESTNLVDYISNGRKLLAINTCAREYVYQSDLSNDIIFWDFNYNFKEHKERLSSLCDYQDGHEMLVLQAKYALAFWSIKNSLS